MTFSTKVCRGRVIMHRSTGCLLLYWKQKFPVNFAYTFNWFIYVSFLFKVCSHDYSTETGVLTSPNYPNNYPVRMECIYTITVGINRQIVLSFTNFSLHGNKRCTEDYVEIRQVWLFLLFLLLLTMEVVQIQLGMFKSHSFNYTPVLPMWDFKGYHFLLPPCSVVGFPTW